MKILHLFSNYRLTGPAEPALNLCLMLQQRGWDISLACHKPPPWVESDLTDIAESMGIKTQKGFHLNKHFNLFNNVKDVRRLGRVLREGGFDMLHVHMTNDHFVGGWARQTSRKSVKIVRSSYEGGGLRNTLRNRMLMKKFTDGLIVFSDMAAKADAERFGLDPEKVFRVDGAVDTHRFNPDRGLESMRPQLNLAQDDFVVGIVARIQLRRKFEDLLSAVKIAVQKVPNLKLMIVGRGTMMHEAVVEPTRKMKLADHVLFAGYHRGDDYVRVLDAMDVKTFLVPGTDGSCRAVREAMAMGKPVIAAERGMLGELVGDGVTGLVVDGSPESLADAMVRLGTDPELRRKMSRAALENAHTRFTVEAQARQIEAVYDAMRARQDV